MNRAVLLLVLLALACTLEDRAALQRRPISPSFTSGWAQVPLDAEAQRQLQGAWIGDAAGRSIPFLVAGEGLWETRPLSLSHQLLGKDSEGRPTVEFSVKLPEGWRVGERETLRLTLDLEGRAPWVAEVRAQRQGEDGAFITFDPPSPLHLYDLSPSGSRRTLDLPWDGQRYRLTLLASQGEAPRIRALTVQAQTRPEALEAELALEGTLVRASDKASTWRLVLPGPDRIVGLDLLLAPPAAPLRPELRLGEGSQAQTGGPCGDLVWNLPALNTQGTRIALAPQQTSSLSFTLPEGATPLRARLLVRRQTLLFPAESGQTYALHLGGEAKPAPGSLGALPALRALEARAPLALGPPEADAQGLARTLSPDQRARPWMPWVAGSALLVLGAVAWRLLKGPPAA